MYELFEHTADLGLRIIAPDLATLFSEAAVCLFSAVVEDLTTIRESQSWELQIPRDGGLDDLLFDWLRALLSHADVHRVLLGRFDVQVTDAGMHARIFGEPIDRDRHPLSHEVKAITYHGLTIEPRDGGWFAEIIVDI
ncbi:archease [Tuwongella immobilis]|uniref:Archease domain-containing protein n=1 Tax=Tuwongella immobilis TaxID=692036 RepID=A0A6C2YVH7_9BACT|nr:archease [Tuwongella immobilis]VIP05173.1 Hypothetical conserved protein OS=uncultured planctomycete GN=HGMM_F01A04C26 PE=4 SV=1: Archease [Tuwongella immobilis]VTS07702.1 Hypothetical conserved protein OS=uncultured planctomycete GN=HGMM_F01A04C26 PE=4 SV=1: Archease [Tuwongella immobilis]